MAKTIDKFPSKRRDKTVPDEWFDGRAWEIIPGKDTNTNDPEKARRVLYQIARARGHKLATRVRDGKVYIKRR